MLDGLQQVVERGEQLDQLHSKTAQIKSQGQNLHKKSKKLNGDMIFHNK